jgi:hypothetical protein
MEMPQTHCYVTGTVTLLWKRHQTHCYATHSTGAVMLLWLPKMSHYGYMWWYNGSKWLGIIYVAST